MGKYSNSFASALALLCAIVIFGSDLARSDHSIMCINLPESMEKSGKRVEYKSGMRSLGMEKFPQNESLWKHFGEDFELHGVLHVYNIFETQRTIMDENTNPHVALRLYRVKNRKTGRYLNTWFRVELEVVKPVKTAFQKLVKVMLLEVVDGPQLQNVGEFSWQFTGGHGNDCPRNDASRYMIISCGGASRSEPLVSNMIVFVRNDTDGPIFPPGVKDIVPNLAGQMKMNFYIRIPMQACNQKRWIYFRARTILDKNAIPEMPKEDLMRTTQAYFRIKGLEYKYHGIAKYDGAWIPGGSDAIPAPSNLKQLDCSEEFNAASTENRPWYAYEKSDSDSYGREPHFKNSKDKFGDNDEPLPKWDVVYACQGFYFKGRCPLSFYDHVNIKFDATDKALRTLKNQNEAQENAIPICEHEPDIISRTDHVKKSRVYFPPTMFNTVNFTGRFQLSIDYIQSKSKPCEVVYNVDENCNISTSLPGQTNGSTSGRRKRDTIHYRPRHIPDIIREKRFFRGLRNRGRAVEEVEDPDFESFTGNGHDSEMDKNKGVGFNGTGFPRIIWGLRKGHASIMTLLMFFVLPVNLFVTRYYKESFMNKRILYSRVWYQVHIQATFLMAALLFAGILIGIVAKQYLGTSLTIAGLLHRVVGYISVFFFVILTVSGGFRGFEDPLRKITIIVHWLLGVIFYSFMAIAMLTAVFIPGSGVSFYDRSTRWDDNSPLQNLAFIQVIFWIIIEVVMHVVMTVTMIGFDKKMEVVESRIYFPVPIPVIRENSRLNTFGHGQRVICLVVYILLALCNTAGYFISNIVGVQGTDKGLGPMSCTHKPDSHEILHKVNEACISVR